MLLAGEVQVFCALVLLCGLQNGPPTYLLTQTCLPYQAGALSKSADALRHKPRLLGHTQSINAQRRKPSLVSATTFAVRDRCAHLKQGGLQRCEAQQVVPTVKRRSQNQLPQAATARLRMVSAGEIPNRVVCHRIEFFILTQACGVVHACQRQASGHSSHEGGNLRLPWHRLSTLQCAFCLVFCVNSPHITTQCCRISHTAALCALTHLMAVKRLNCTCQHVMADVRNVSPHNQHLITACVKQAWAWQATEPLLATSGVALRTEH